MARAESRIADAKENEISMQHARTIHVAIADHEGRPGERIDGQKGVGRGSSHQLGVRRRRIQAALVLPVEQLAV